MLDGSTVHIKHRLLSMFGSGNTTVSDRITEGWRPTMPETLTEGNKIRGSENWGWTLRSF
jgi:hypothetical protein